jgi:soluble lytic murein transglycosylase
MSRSAVVLIAFLVLVIGGSLLLGDPETGTGVESGAADWPAGGPRESDPVTAPGVPEQVSEFLRAGQAWRAARAMREQLQRGPNPHPEAVLLAARAEAAWGGWDQVRSHLQGRPWLDEVRGGEAWYWLGRAFEESREVQPALDAYARFLASPGEQGAQRRQTAELRRGLLLLGAGRAEEGASMLERMRDGAPGVANRLDVLAAEALARTGDTVRVRRLSPSEGSADVQRRARLALVEAYARAEDRPGALAVARSALAGAGTDADRAVFGLRSARLGLAVGDTAAAREDLRGVIRRTPGTGSAREAALLLGSLPGITTADRLEIARVLERHGAARDAVRFFRAWLAAGEGSAAERRQVQLSIGRGLFNTGDFAGALTALSSLASAEGEIGAQAMYLTGQAEGRRGNAARSREIYLALAARHPGTAPGSEGLYLVADHHHDRGDAETARRLYRRVANDFPGTDRAGLSLMRLAGMSYLTGDFASAARVWEEYRAAYPTGSRWLEATYWVARSHQRIGQADLATQYYRAIREREPLSYYALRSAERLGEPYWPLALGEAPPDDPGTRATVGEWMRAVDLLRDAGLYSEAEAEADALIARAGEDTHLLYALAEELNERGYASRGIRIGIRLNQAAERPDARLLRILYPFPYRSLVEAEAREKNLDPFVVAALIRQESNFTARIASPAGARGLMQVMPETGRGLAAGAGIRNWDVELLYQPEINAHLGTRFLADQMRIYDGSLPSVFSAYNAGPQRIERWKNYPEYRDEELFTERIPFRETRDYVKILTRNIAVYRGLYQ